jgi:hypothetical protein
MVASSLEYRYGLEFNYNYKVLGVVGRFFGFFGIFSEDDII